MRAKVAEKRTWIDKSTPEDFTAVKIVEIY